MLTQEEIRYNEAKKRFDRRHEKIEAAIRYYNNAWTDYTKERAGLTPELYQKILDLEEEIYQEFPHREIIYEATRLSVEASDLVGVPTKNNFISILRNRIQKFLARFNQRNIGNTIEATDSGSQEAIDAIPSDEFEAPFREINEWGEEIFNVDRLVDECREAYEILRDRSQQLDRIYEAKINNPPKGNIIGTKRDGPGILDDYRQSSWGIERICLDGFQNHLPADSKGTQAYLHFKVGGKWVDCETAKQNKGKITEVRFSDNGVGFTPDNLFYLHSTKTSEDSSAGQFGEGMKLASIAAVNLNLGLEFQSRNWRAIATSEAKKIVNTRKNDEEEARKKLVYDVTEYDGEPIIGSRTIFHSPSPEFIDYVLRLPKKVLLLGGKKPKFFHEGVEIIDFERGGEAFVKGIYLTDIPSMFSYNFTQANVNPDRNGFHNYDYSQEIKKTIAKMTNPEMIQLFLSKIVAYTTENEFRWERCL